MVKYTYKTIIIRRCNVPDVTISKPKLYDTSARVKFEALSKAKLTDKLTRKVQKVTKELFLANKLTGEFTFQATKKGIKIIKKDGTKFTLKNSQEASRKILAICQKLWDKDHPGSPSSPSSRLSGSADATTPTTAFPLRADYEDRYSILPPSPSDSSRLTDRPTPPTSPGATATPAIVSGNPHSGVDVDQLLREFGALQLDHSARGRKIEELTDERDASKALVAQRDQTIQDLTDEIGASKALVDQLDQTIGALDNQRDAATALADQHQRTIGTLTHEKDAATQLAAQREQTIRGLTGERDTAAQLAAERQQAIQDLTGERDEALDLIDQHAQTIETLTGERDVATRLVVQRDETIRDLLEERAASRALVDQLDRTISTLERERDVATRLAAQHEQTIQNLTGERDNARALVDEHQRTIGTLTGERDTARKSVEQLSTQLDSLHRDYVDLSSGIDSLKAENQAALQQLAEKTDAAATAQRTLQERDAELRKTQEHSATTSKRVDEQAEKILQLEASLQQATEQNERLNAQRLELQTRFQRMEEERQLDLLTPVAPDSSIAQAELKSELERMTESKLALEEAYRKESQQQVQLIRELQSIVSTQTEKSEADADKLASLEQQIARKEEVIANLRKRLEELREEMPIAIQKATLDLEQKLYQKQIHVKQLQATLAAKESELEQSFQERTQGMQEELERLEALKKQLTTDNQQMKSRLATQEKEIGQLKEWDADSNQRISELSGATVQNRSLRQELEERTAQLSSLEKQILKLTAQVEQQAEYLEAGKAEIIKLSRELEENTSEDALFLLEQMEDQEASLQKAGELGKALLEQNELLQEENAQLKEKLADTSAHLKKIAEQEQRLSQMQSEHISALEARNRQISQLTQLTQALHSQLDTAHFNEIRYRQELDHLARSSDVNPEKVEGVKQRLDRAKLQQDAQTLRRRPSSGLAADDVSFLQSRYGSGVVAGVPRTRINPTKINELDAKLGPLLQKKQ